ncbi:MAG: antibiotic biosynthesis monooxygenase [Gammaproteobacteria bacterium]|nr:antibiotic biosynthesis monooxygenase [Gammaproteobacteria bacterium]MDH5693560.1 antibiotic biosynthesis monooxygenase [Gammaproteobacteria bacterium]
MHYVVCNRVPVLPGYEEMFEERFRNRAGKIELQPGFVRMQVLKPRSENTPFVVFTTWENEQAFLNWVDSEDFREAHRNPMPKEAFSSSGGGLEQFEVVILAESS